MAKPVATAASIALPPRFSMSAPIRAAIFSCATTMPCSATTAWIRVGGRRRVGAAALLLRGGAAGEQASDERDAARDSAPVVWNEISSNFAGVNQG